MCDKLELGVMVAGGGTVGAVATNRFLVLTPSLTPSVASVVGWPCQCRGSGLVETGSVSTI